MHLRPRLHFFFSGVSSTVHEADSLSLGLGSVTSLQPLESAANNNVKCNNNNYINNDDDNDDIKL